MSSNFEVIQGPYFHDLLEQPEALRATWEGLHRAPFDQIRRECTTGRFARVILTGMGSSFFGLHPLSMELAANGWTPVLLETSELIHSYAGLLTPETLVVAVSQSGRSAETVRLLELNAKRAKILAVTNWADSPLAQQADFAVLTAAGKEHTVSCKTYVSTLMELQVLGAALCDGDTSARLRHLEPAAGLATEYLDQWRSHVAELAPVLSGIRSLFLVGRGASMASASTGALISKESTHFHAEGMSSAAFRHGPFEMLEAGILVGIFGGDQNSRELNGGLLRDIERTPARAFLVSPDSKIAACKLPPVPDALRQIAEILPVQMMTLALAALARREAGHFDRATKITEVE